MAAKCCSATEHECCSESKIIKHLRDVNEPQTLDEITVAISSSSPVDTEAAVCKLVHNKSICCKDLILDGDTVKLYLINHRGPGSAVLDSSNPAYHEQSPIGQVRVPLNNTRLPFKSPVKVPTTSGPVYSDSTPLSSRGVKQEGLLSQRPMATGVSDMGRLSSTVHRLKEKLEEVEKDIEGLAEEYSEDELQLHIDKLHEYNEVKDLGQFLLGKIAEVEGTTTAVIHERFGF